MSLIKLTEDSWKSLYTTRWVAHMPHLTEYLLNAEYTPPQKTKMNEDRLNAKTMKRFHDIKDSM